MRSLIASIALVGSDRPGDAAVLPHSPEMDSDQEGGHERNADAVQHVEPDESPPTDGAPGDQCEARARCSRSPRAQ